MAGRCESCSHVAATVYLLEYAAKAEASASCTDKLNGWLPPTIAGVPPKRVRDVDFSSSTARLKRLDRLVEVVEGTVFLARITVVL